MGEMLTVERLKDLVGWLEEQLTSEKQARTEAEANAARFHALMLQARAELVGYKCPTCGTFRR